VVAKKEEKLNETNRFNGKKIQMVTAQDDG
jgi:hypothetical protein